MQAPPRIPGLSRVALVIGNRAYGGEMEVAHANASAAAIARRLTDLGYHVIVVGNADRAHLVASFEAFGSSCSGCCAILYFCGHGWQDGGSADCLLVPVDFAGTDPAG